MRPLDVTDSVRQRVELSYLVAAVGAVLWGTGPVLVKNLEIGGVAMNAYRWLVIALCVYAIDVARGQPMQRSAMRSAWLPGCMIGINVSLFFSAARETSVANATIINSLHPLVVAVIATRFLGERIGWRSAVSGLVALAATMVVVLGEPPDGVNTAWGDLLAVGSAITFALVYVASKQTRQKLSTTHFFTATSLWAAGVSAVLAIIVGQDLSFPVRSDWIGLLALVAIPGLLGTGMVWWSVGRIPVWISSALGLLIPVSAAAIAWLALDERLTLVQVVAMLVAVGALTSVVRERPTG